MGSKFKMVIIEMLGLLLLGGCGGSGTDPGGVNDPFAPNQQGDPLPSGNGTVLSYGMSLTTAGSSGGTTVGSNSTIIATATLKDSNSKPVANQPVLFEEVVPTSSDSPSVTIPVPVASTSSEGKATTILTTDSTTVNKDVIIKASTSINGQEISAISIFTIARSTGNYIHFISSKDPTDPDGTMNSLKATLTEVDPAANPLYGILQLVTVEVLDRNGIKRTHVPVQLEVVNILGSSCFVEIGAEMSSTETIMTDDTGLGIFSAEVIMATPPIGGVHSCTVIYKATTPDPYAATPTDLFSYGGYVATLENKKDTTQTQPTSTN